MQVFPTTGGLEVYINESGDIVLRQECTIGGDDDFVVIPKQHLNAVIRAMRQVAKDGAD